MITAAMIAFVLGLAMPRGGSPVVGTAAAAAPPAVTPIPTLTVTPIEEPIAEPIAEPPVAPVNVAPVALVNVAPVAPVNVVPVAPVEAPSVASVDVPSVTARAVPSAPPPVTKMRDKTRKRAERKVAKQEVEVKQEVERPRPEKRKAATGRLAKIDVSKCVGTALGCLKVTSLAKAVATTKDSKSSKKRK